jgi:hypothetical protein
MVPRVEPCFCAKKEDEGMAEQTKRQQLEMHLAGRALRDPDFRARLLEDPKRTIEEEIDLHFPATLNIRIHEEKLNELHVVLPVDLETLGELTPVDSSHIESLPFWKRVLARKVKEG